MIHRNLSPPLRRSLETAVRQAREIATAGAEDAIRRLGVSEPEAPIWLGHEDKAVRRRLRAHARALGDRKNEDRGHTVDRLIEAAAYVQWHRRLFARFLAERGLLRHPGHDVPITLEEAEEIGREEGHADGWAAAEAYAARMLPAVFQPEDAVLSLTLAPEHAQGLRKLVLGLDPAIFQGNDALGWTYQYWRGAEKDRVNKSGVKIGADELPAVTQLFTEPYMVRFLLDNTLGAWWAGKRFAANPSLADAPDEQSLRERLALPGADWAWLRFVRKEEGGSWRSAAGTFQGWPNRAAEITLLDPCCGSGHFLTEALPILVALRRAEDDTLSPSAAVAAVLRNNLHGLEIDGRCVQIASFAVALTAWAVGGWQALPNPHIAWVGQAPKFSKAEFEALGNGDPQLRNALGALYDLFRRAPLLGSLIEVTGGDLAQRADLAGVEEAMIKLAERAAVDEPDRVEGAIAARGMADAAALLGRQYTILTTNPPFQTRQSLVEDIRNHLDIRYPTSSADLSTAMLDRLRASSSESGTLAVVTPTNFFSQPAYRNFRRDILSIDHLQMIARLGARAFSEISGEVVKVALLILSKGVNQSGDLLGVIDAADDRTPADKDTTIRRSDVRIKSHSELLANPSHRIIVDELLPYSLTRERFISRTGTRTGDNARILRNVWEIPAVNPDFRFMQSVPDRSQLYSGRSLVMLWENGAGALAALNEVGVASIQGQDAWGKNGIAIGLMGKLPATVYSGEIYDMNTGVLLPHNAQDLAALFCFMESGEYQTELRKIDQQLKLTTATLLDVPFDEQRWRTIAAARYPKGLPEACSDDPTQWLFHGHPANAEKGTALHVALSRIAGYRWPAETDQEMRLSAEAREWITRAAALPDADPDGLLPLSAGAGDRPLAERLRAYLAAAFGSEWNEPLERRLIAEADETLDKKMAKDASLEGWLRDRAFRQHCRLFRERPFLWHVWDGHKNGFAAFLNYHRLDQRTLQKLTYTLVGDWIARRTAEGDDPRIEAATILKRKLEFILEGEAPYDIFVRWKPLAQQPLGWNPDLVDGVRLNIRPWITAGVLRDSPKIKWGVDRGKDVPSAPWFQLDKGNRDNDRHTTLAEKQTARTEGTE